jgi:hypothetical protein
MSIGNVLIILFMLATLGVLIAGVVLMGAGGEANKRYANKLMMMRVSLQGMAVLLLVFLYASSK